MSTNKMKTHNDRATVVNIKFYLDSGDPSVWSSEFVNAKLNQICNDHGVIYSNYKFEGRIKTCTLSYLDEIACKKSIMMCEQFVNKHELSANLVNWEVVQEDKLIDKLIREAKECKMLLTNHKQKWRENERN